MPSENAPANQTSRPGTSRRLVIRLERSSSVPPFEQLRAQISVMVAVGRLEPGSRLPTVRELAEQLELAPGTVARAYRELEGEGTVVARLPANDQVPIDRSSR